MAEYSNKKIGNALKWSVYAEIAAKLILPISNMILARLLTPEMFGVVATVTMIVSFADIFTDSGFHKYMVQHEFADETEYQDSANISFWSNLALSFLIWGIIILFREKIAVLVGNPGLGNIIALAGVAIPITGFSALQMSLLKREMNFKKLFYVRIGIICFS